MKVSMLERPIFLVGAERSGTTLLRLMLDCHTQLAWCNEFEYAIDLISDSKDYPKLETYYKWLSTHRIFQDSQFKINRSLDYPHLVNSFLIQKQIRDNKQFVGATVHRHFDRLINIWSDAKYIHIVRDGRDVARSCIGMGWAGNVWTGIERWIEVETLWQRFSKSLLTEQKIEVTYESLILESESTLETICSFIGIPFEQDMFTYNRTTNYDLPNPELVQQWKRKLSEREIQLIESRISKMLIERHYELSGLPIIKINSIMQFLLRWQDKIERIKHRIKHIGIPLYVADNLSRRLQFHSWQKNIKLKLNDIDRAHLK